MKLDDCLQCCSFCTFVHLLLAAFNMKSFVKVQYFHAKSLKIIILKIKNFFTLKAFVSFYPCVYHNTAVVTVFCNSVSLCFLPYDLLKYITSLY